MSRWAFSYTRLNIHLAAAAAAAGGCIVVDSTRAGKRFPDSFTTTVRTHHDFGFANVCFILRSATAQHVLRRKGGAWPLAKEVPIWCCLLNRLAAPTNDDSGTPSSASIGGERSSEKFEQGSCPRKENGNFWDTALHTPRWLSASEASQIEERMPGWIQGLGNAKEALSERLRSFLKKPLRAVWLSPESRLVERMLPACSAADLSFTPVICVSASKVIAPERHREHHSWIYLQGAGDDEEHWSSGITPEQFWANSERLIGLAKRGDRGAFEGVIAALITRNKKMNASSPCAGGTESRSGSGAARSEETPTGGGPSSTERHDGGEEPWQPGGPEVHAVLGATGLVVGSIAYAARNWASHGTDCSLLNLRSSDRRAAPLRAGCGGKGTNGRLCSCPGSPWRVMVTVPEIVLIYRPLHSFRTPGKKANPPRYWQKTVFPAALVFIASAVGDLRLPPARKGMATDQSAAVIHVQRHGEAAEPFVHEGPHVGEEAAASPDRNLPSCCGGKVGETSAVDTPDPARLEGAEGISSPAEADTRAIATSSAQPRLRQQCQAKRGGAGVTMGPVTAGKCLVVCPTGADASVVVCLCALVAFFPPGPQANTNTPSGNQNQQPQQQQLLSPSSRHALVADEADGGNSGLWLGGGGFSVLPRTAAGVVTKSQLRWRFLLMQQECPWAHPPRRSMQELNEYFMTPGEHSWWTLSDRYHLREADSLEPSDAVPPMHR
ncbi:unnamed protein product [Ectocarpus sp. CCAP 1310/34]|nr:unnamed protein product [Ectocarpus sp. CCAP 1310/34]